MHGCLKKHCSVFSTVVPINTCRNKSGEFITGGYWKSCHRLNTLMGDLLEKKMSRGLDLEQNLSLSYQLSPVIPTCKPVGGLVWFGGLSATPDPGSRPGLQIYQCPAVRKYTEEKNYDCIVTWYLNREYFNPKIFRRYPKEGWRRENRGPASHDWWSFYMSQYDRLKGSHIPGVIWPR